ncbi:MAG: EAL domain-containing protein [Lachnospiraceae bacterium]|nr:EAL domain-containing protein [Lachnospiraceae bacterium]
MAMYSNQQQVLDNDLMEEQAKQIALDFFYSYYVRRDLEGVLWNVSDRVHWIGSKEYFVARSKEEMRKFLQKEIQRMPHESILKVISSEVVMLGGGCYNVTGELEVRVPYHTQISYYNLRYSMVVLCQENEYEIASIHTSLSEGEDFGQNGETNGGNPLHQMAKDIKNQAQYDMLTGVYTLDYFKEEARRFLDKNGKTGHYAMLCTDIDHYEQINNLYGLKRADKILSDLATLLTTCSQTVQLCCRSVADHFVLLVSYTEVGRLKLLLKNINEAFWKSIGGEYSEARPNLGFGVYLIENTADDIGKMVECANVARKSLHYQKSSSAFFDVQVFRKMERVRKIEQTMKGALEEGEFKVYLQPKYGLEAGKIVGAEALCRWIRRDGSMVYPDEFIPIFEKNGFIKNLDFYMLDEICKMIQKRLKQKKRCVSVSINQSRVLLSDRDYVARIAAVLAKHNTPAKYIELELTERIFKDDLSGIAQMMKSLKELGIRWSIDDFGTGYSSLNLLKDLPVDIIKIDKSFLDETETSDASKIIIRKTVELTQELDKMVVCEGVETESQADYLRNIQCDMAQGYLYAKPMPMNEFEQLLDEG